MVTPLKRLRRWLAGKALKATGLSFIPPWIRHSFSRYAFRTLVTEGYKGNATVFACLFLLARTFPEPELWPWQPNKDGEDERVINHELRRLLAAPNADMGEAELMKFVITYTPLSGNSYLWKQRNNRGRVIALWPFHDGYMTPVPGRNSQEGVVAYYVLDIGTGQQTNPWNIDRFDTLGGTAIPKIEIIHWTWMVDPERPERGIGALEAAAGDIDTANEIKKYIFSLLKNDAKPPIVVNMAEGDEFDEDKASRLRAQWQAKYGGSNRGLPAFLEFGMNVKELGFNLQQLEIDSLRDGPDAAVCMGFGISPVIIGALVGLKNSTYSNFQEARIALTELTLIPLWRSFASEVQQSMADEPGYGRDISIRFDLSQVRALLEDVDAVWQRVQAAWDSGLITRSQALNAMGYKATPADEVYKQRLTDFYVPAGQMAPALPEAQGDDEEPKFFPVHRNGNGAHNGYRNLLPADKDGTITFWHFDSASIKGHDLKQFADDDGDAPSTRRADPGEYRRQQQTIISLRRLRESLVPRAAEIVTEFFTAFGRAAEGTIKSMQLLPGYTVVKTAVKRLTQEDIDRLEALLYGQLDEDKLEQIITSIRLMTADESWETINTMIDTDAQFDVNDPAVVEVLGRARNQVRAISDSTKTMLQQHLQAAYDAGWSIEDVARGRGDRPGIRDFLAETYKGRAETIARTEIGMAQNGTTVGRFEAAGADGVIVFDGGGKNSDDICNQLDSTVQTLGWAAANPLQHPNCIRAFGAWFGD